jgi:hypothetical protein
MITNERALAHHVRDAAHGDDPRTGEDWRPGGRSLMARRSEVGEVERAGREGLPPLAGGSVAEVAGAVVAVLVAVSWRYGYHRDELCGLVRHRRGPRWTTPCMSRQRITAISIDAAATLPPDRAPSYVRDTRSKSVGPARATPHAATAPPARPANETCADDLARPAGTGWRPCEPCTGCGTSRFQQPVSDRQGSRKAAGPHCRVPDEQEARCAGC